MNMAINTGKAASLRARLIIYSPNRVVQIDYGIAGSRIVKVPRITASPAHRQLQSSLEGLTTGAT